MRETERLLTGNYLDIGGFCITVPPLFKKSAIDNAGAEFYIVDLRAKEAKTEGWPGNLTILPPDFKKSFLPFGLKYKLPFPNNYFASARMDMVMDFLLDIELRFKVFREIRRCLVFGGELNIVDAEVNRKQAETACRLLRFNQIEMISNSPLLLSDYDLSPVTEAFTNMNIPLFRLRAVK